MALLDTFAILFQTDAKKAADDVENLNENLDDTQKSADDASQGMDGFNDATNKSSIGIAGMTKAVGGLIASYIALDAVASGVIGNAASVDEIGKFAEVTGNSIVEIDAWGEAVARNGGSAQAFRGTLESLSTSLADISLTGGGEAAQTLARLGINAFDAGGKVKSAFAILPDLADSFQQLSTAQSFQFGKKLGLDQGTILLLQQGREAVDELVQRQKSLGAATKDTYNESAIFNDQLDDTKRVFGSLSIEATTALLPALTEVLKLLENGVQWVRENQSLVEGFFLGVAGVITAVYLPSIASAAAATLVAIAPFVAIGAAIAAVGTAVAIVYEDITAWVNGSSSAIGDLLGSFEDFKASVFQIFDDIGKKFTDWLEDFKASVFQIFDDIAKKFTDWIDDFKDFGKSIDDFFSFGDDKDLNFSANSKQALDLIHSYNANPLNSGPAYNSSSFMSNSTYNLNLGGTTVNANGLTPEQATQVVGDSFSNQINMAYGAVDDGVDH